MIVHQRLDISNFSKERADCYLYVMTDENQSKSFTDVKNFTKVNLMNIANYTLKMRNKSKILFMIKN